MFRQKLIAIGALPLIALSAPAQAQSVGDKIPNSYICVYKANAVSRTGVDLEAFREVMSIGGRMGHVYRVAFQGFSANLSAQAVEQLKASNPKIAYCEQDQIVAVPPISELEARAGGSALQRPAPSTQETPWGVARVKGGTPGKFGTAWIIDTGVDLTHPDLNVDVRRSRSFLTGKPWAGDQNGHGTHVAGTIAAYNNSFGVVGVAPGARVVSVRVLNGMGEGTVSSVIAGVEYVAANARPGDVANMSLGGGVSAAVDAAVANAAAGGVKFVIAAGNSSTHANNESPARVNAPNVYTVSAFGNGNTWASFSNYGNPPIDYAEPGVAIKSTWLGGGYKTLSGTSMAAPHLAGILLARANPIVDGTVIGDPAAPADPIGTR